MEIWRSKRTAFFGAIASPVVDSVVDGKYCQPSVDQLNLFGLLISIPTNCWKRDSVVNGPREIEREGVS